MEIKLVFLDWEILPPDRASDAEILLHLSNGDFHSGSTFSANIDLTEEQAAELQTAMDKGYRPVFWATK